MKIRILVLLCAVALMASCGKDDKPNPECKYGMQAYYYWLIPSEQHDTVASITPYVKDGVFKMASLPDFNINYWTNIHFVDSSSCGLFNGLQVAGDTITLEVMLKNPVTGDGSLTANDIGLYIAGQIDTAMVLVVSNPIHIASTSLKVGNNGITAGSSKLITSYDSFTKLSLKANSGTLSFLANDTLVASTSYGSAQIGLVKDFRISFLGTGSIDYIRVYGKSGKLLMSNEFTDVTTKWQGIQF